MLSEIKMKFELKIKSELLLILFIEMETKLYLQ